MRTARHRIPLAIALLAGSAVAFGQTTAQEHAAHHPDQQTAAAGAATDAAKAPPGGTTQESVKEMHDRAAKMHKLMEQIQRTKDPTERARRAAYTAPARCWKSQCFSWPTGARAGSPTSMPFIEKIMIMNLT